MVEMKKSSNYRGKCIICGDSTTGKSALVQVFCSDGAQYPKTYNMTTGVDLVVKQVNIPETRDSVELFLYDTAGKDIFSDIVTAHLHDVSMVAYVYDASNEASFQHITQWHEMVQSSNKKKIPGVLIANKMDLRDRNLVETSLGEELAQKLSLTYFECSAKDMQQTDVPFQHLAKAFYDSQMNPSMGSEQQLVAEDDDE